MTSWIALTLGIALAACGHGRPEGPPAAAELMSLTLEVPRLPAANEVVWARIEVGALPPGARLVVRTTDGGIAGTVAPFGPVGREGGVYTIPLPQEAIADGKVTLILGVLEDLASEARPPLEGEVGSVELILVQVTPDSRPP